MLRTMDGKRISDVIKEHDDKGVTNYTFVIDGNTSKWKGHDGQIIEVFVTSLWVRLFSDQSQIKIPNMIHDTLSSMIEYAAEILLFEYGFRV